MRLPKEQVVMAAQGHSQPQRSHQFVAGLLGRNRISDPKTVIEMGWTCNVVRGQAVEPSSYKMARPAKLKKGGRKKEKIGWQSHSNDGK
ncbi:hypothetical protein EVAR_28759_1 [Eumeta japonica]|uniref:Uncharacterized protein n=1 Tax=Eumeta variegata TaxID=151549 RepID=A0A4C1VFV4_EUMVA|nr:hypothetical protein EVAR_28759_1 [Eumeta japonica]